MSLAFEYKIHFVKEVTDDKMVAACGREFRKTPQDQTAGLSAMQDYLNDPRIVEVFSLAGRRQRAYVTSYRTLVTCGKCVKS